jgi:hypothetical protein
MDHGPFRRRLQSAHGHFTGLNYRSGSVLASDMISGYSSACQLGGEPWSVPVTCQSLASTIRSPRRPRPTSEGQNDARQASILHLPSCEPGYG